MRRCENTWKPGEDRRNRLPDKVFRQPQRVAAVLGAGDFDILIPGEFCGHEDHRVIGAVEGLVEAGGEEAGFQARGTEDSLLGEGDALAGEEFLEDGFWGVGMRLAFHLSIRQEEGVRPTVRRGQAIEDKGFTS